MSVKVAKGHIVVNDRWCGTELLSKLSRKVNVDLLSTDVVDFYPFTDAAAIYITEAALISGREYRKNIVKLRKVGCSKTLVIVEKTNVTESFYPDLQNFAVLELGIQVLPVPGESECAELLTFLVQQNATGSDPFSSKSRMPPIQTCLLNSLCKIPSLGPVKAQLLLDNFPNLKTIGRASVEELADVIGQNSAEKVHEFFHS